MIGSLTAYSYIKIKETGGNAVSRFNISDRELFQTYQNDMPTPIKMICVHYQNDMFESEKHQ